MARRKWKKELAPSPDTPGCSSIPVAFHRNTALRIRLLQAPVDLPGEDAEHVLLDLLVVQEQREEVLVLLQALDQRVVDIVVERELEVLLAVVPRGRLQSFRLHQDIPDLQHRLNRHVAVVRLARARVNLGDDFAQPRDLGFRQVEPVRLRQLHDRPRHLLLTLAAMRLVLLLDELARLDLPGQVEPAAAAGHAQVGEQIRDEHVLLMYVDILEAARLQQELVEPHEPAHLEADLLLLLRTVLPHRLLRLAEIEGQRLLLGDRDSLLALLEEQVAEALDIQRIQNHEGIQVRLQIVDMLRIDIARQQRRCIERRERRLHFLVTWA